MTMHAFSNVSITYRHCNTCTIAKTIIWAKIKIRLPRFLYNIHRANIKNNTMRRDKYFQRYVHIKINCLYTLKFLHVGCGGEPQISTPHWITSIPSSSHMCCVVLYGFRCGLYCVNAEHSLLFPCDDWPIEACNHTDREHLTLFFLS